jgi:hypothetical protein
MHRLFLAASSLFAAIPGVAVLLTGAGVPPGSKALFGGTLEVFGALTILILWVNRSRIRRLKQQAVTKYSILLAGGAFVALAVYVVLIGYCVAQAPGRTPVFFPLMVSDSIAGMVDAAGSRDATLPLYGSEEVREVIHESAPVALGITTVLLLLLYLIPFISIAAAFGIVGIKTGADLLKDTPQQHRGVAAQVSGVSEPQNSAPTKG